MDVDLCCSPLATPSGSVRLLVWWLGAAPHTPHLKLNRKKGRGLSDSEIRSRTCSGQERSESFCTFSGNNKKFVGSGPLTYLLSPTRSRTRSCHCEDRCATAKTMPVRLVSPDRVLHIVPNVDAVRPLVERCTRQLAGRSLPPPFCCCRRDASQPAASSIHRAPPLDPILSQHPARGHLPRRRCSRLWRSAAAAARAAPTADGACGFDPRTTLSCGRARK